MCWCDSRAVARGTLIVMPHSAAQPRCAGPASKQLLRRGQLLDTLLKRLTIKSWGSLFWIRGVNDLADWNKRHTPTPL